MALRKRRKGKRKKAQELEEQQTQRELRSERFRILVCIDGTDESYEGLRYAADIARSDDCDIVLLYVRDIDRGLSTGGMQMSVARENMLEWGQELPDVQHLRTGMDILLELGFMGEDWKTNSAHSAAFGDSVGDHKIEYKSEAGKSVVLKLKTAPDPVAGILDQYELGPYNLIIIGTPSRWRGIGFNFWKLGVSQRVAMLAPCSVLVTRHRSNKKGHLICTDGTEQSLDAMARAAVLANHMKAPITLMTVAREAGEKSKAKSAIKTGLKMIRELGIRKKITTKIAMGDPVDQILNMSSRFDLVAVSDTGKSKLKRFLVGSVAFDVMGQTSNSVLNVR